MPLTRPSICSGFSVKCMFLTAVPRFAVNPAPLTARSLMRWTESPSASGVPLASLVG